MTKDKDKVWYSALIINFNLHYFLCFKQDVLKHYLVFTVVDCFSETVCIWRLKIIGMSISGKHQKNGFTFEV